LLKNPRVNVAMGVQDVVKIEWIREIDKVMGNEDDCKRILMEGGVTELTAETCISDLVLHRIGFLEVGKRWEEVEFMGKYASMQRAVIFGWKLVKEESVRTLERMEEKKKLMLEKEVRNLPKEHAKIDVQKYEPHFQQSSEEGKTEEMERKRKARSERKVKARKEKMRKIEKKAAVHPQNKKKSTTVVKIEDYGIKISKNTKKYQTNLVNIVWLSLVFLTEKGIKMLNNLPHQNLLPYFERIQNIEAGHKNTRYDGEILTLMMDERFIREMFVWYIENTFPQNLVMSTAYRYSLVVLNVGQFSWQHLGKMDNLQW